MAAVRTRHTLPELTLRAHLSALGLRYGLHGRGLPGRPDIVFARARIAVFCDGGFWHGRDLAKRLAKGQFKVRRAYWTAKIRANVARDRRNTRALRARDWLVLRFWCLDIQAHPETIALFVRDLVERRLALPGSCQGIRSRPNPRSMGV